MSISKVTVQGREITTINSLYINVYSELVINSATSVTTIN